MPSRNQPANTTERMRCPKLRERLGEDPARWLDWDLLADASRKTLVFSLIEGIDTYERLEAWRAVEKRLANDRFTHEARNPLEDTRDAIMRRLDQREKWLDLHGERPDRLSFGPREACDCCDADGFVTAADLRERDRREARRRSEGYSPDGVDTSETSPETEPTALGEFATDGGVSE